MEVYVLQQPSNAETIISSEIVLNTSRISHRTIYNIFFFGLLAADQDKQLMRANLKTNRQQIEKLITIYSLF